MWFLPEQKSHLVTKVGALKKNERGLEPSLPRTADGCFNKSCKKPKEPTKKSPDNKPTPTLTTTPQTSVSRKSRGERARAEAAGCPVPLGPWATVAGSHGACSRFVRSVCFLFPGPGFLQVP